MSFSHVLLNLAFSSSVSSPDTVGTTVMTAFLDSLDTGRIVSLRSAVVLIGRGAECDLIIDHSCSISRLHCAIVQTDDLYFIRDMGSTNGVWIDGNRIEHQARLQNGQQFSVGDVRFIFRCGNNIRIHHNGRKTLNRSDRSGFRLPTQTVKTQADQQTLLNAFSAATVNSRSQAELQQATPVAASSPAD